VEDRSFVKFVAKMIRGFGFIPCRTVGMYSAAPKPLYEQMREGIKAADCIIIAASPRYRQQDISERTKRKKGISEMIHTEAGLAIAYEKPVLVFASEGTDVGTLLPTVTQYFIIKRGDKAAFRRQYPLIQDYFINAYLMIQKRWQAEDRKQLVEALKTGLAIVGVGAIIKMLFDNEK
jgi:hypothetical protein